MPRFDGTGPAGMGPRTGRGFGFCGGYGCPMGRGMGCCFNCGWPATKKAQAELLENYLENIQEEAEEIKKELEELKKNG